MVELVRDIKREMMTHLIMPFICTPDASTIKTLVDMQSDRIVRAVYGGQRRAPVVHLEKKIGFYLPDFHALPTPEHCLGRALIQPGFV